LIEALTPLGVVEVGPAEQEGAIRLLRKFSDQGLSLTDVDGLHVMAAHRITRCWSTGRHLGLTGASLIAQEL
jgi:hypothetical protein